MPSSGLAANVSVFTAIMSMISPGISLDVKTWTAVGDCFNTMLNCGFHSAAAVTPGVVKEATASASEVFMILISRWLRPWMSRARDIR
ncbi:hypothetical protein D3C81_2127840 [compost metagenome]